MLDEAKMRRLAMIQYMYTMAVDQSHQPEPLNMLSIQLFHDAVEHFLALASEHLDAGKTGQAFMAYWEPISQKLPNKDFGHKDSMNRLNAARSNWKHHGISLPTTEIDDFRTNVAGFFRENTPKVFGIDFEAMSMAILVQDEEVRNRLVKAEQLSSTGEFKAALAEIAIAFLALLEGLEWKALEQNSIHLQTVSSRRIFSQVENAAPKELARFAKAIDRELDILHKQVMLLSLGIDYRRYMRFRGRTPLVDRTMDGVYHVTEIVQEQTQQDYLFCSQFVIECALRVQELLFV